MQIDAIVSGIMATVTDPMCLALIFLGTVMGLTFGCLPGLTSVMGLSLLIPITYTLEPIPAFGLLLGCYVGGVSGGAISACLLNIPGTPSAICTTLDGYPMTQRGEGARALGWAALASGIGTFLSWIMLIVLSSLLAAFCKDFSSTEYASVSLLGLLLVTAMSKKNFAKGIVACAIGVFLSCIGVDQVYGTFRFTFGSADLLNGFYTVPVCIGIFSIPQVISMYANKTDNKQPKVKLKNLFPSLREIWAHKVNILRSACVGTIIGVIPAIGQSAAAFFAYDLAKRGKSPEPQKFGEGNVDGVIAPETANNAVCGGAMVPMLTLGIPGDACTAILIGGLTLKGLRAGPTLFMENYNIVVGLYTCLLFATIFMVLIQTLGIKMFCKILAVPGKYLAPILVVLSMVGCYAVRNNPFDCVVCIALGVAGYFLDKAGYNLTSIVMGLVLGGNFEAEIRRTLIATQNDWLTFITRPISCVILVLCLVVVVWTIYSQWRISHGKKNKFDEADEMEEKL